MLKDIKHWYKRNALWLAITNTLVVVYLSLFRISSIRHIVDFSYIDKYQHLLAYFVLCLSWLVVVANKTKKYKYITLFSIVFFGGLMEVLQQVLTDYRQADIYDVVANSIGVLIGFFVFEKLSKTIFKEFFAE